MTDFSALAALPLPPPYIGTYSRYGTQPAIRGVDGQSAPASQTWTTANQARYYPMTLPFPYVVRRVWWVNGSSASGNRDFGIYSIGGARIFSTGSTAASGASVPQWVTVTPFLLPPGDYYFAFNSSDTTNAVAGGATSAAQQRFAGILQEAVGATALPATATFATATVATVNMCGISWSTS